MSDFPDFRRPPVAEVALSVQFEGLSAFHAAHFGLLWQEFRHSYPKTQEQHPLPPTIENFGVRGSFPQGINISVGPAPPMPRCWFLNEDETRLIQVQQDRFIHNWRRRPDGQGSDYPRYPGLRESFKSEIGVFLRFLQKESLGTPKPNQCELIYVDQIEAQSDVWKDHGDFAHLVVAWRDLNDALLSRPENVTLNARYLMKDQNGEPIGRVHITFTPIFNQNAPVYMAQFLVRGAPIGEGFDAAFEFFDKAHEYAVHAFLSMTTESLKEMWGIYRA